MSKVIIYTVEQEALDICTRLITCKGENDSVYSIPIKKYDENKWFVQVLDKDLVHLTAEEFGSLVDLQNDWFEPFI